MHKQINENSSGLQKIITNDGNNGGSFRPYGNLLSANNHFINSNLSSSSAGFLNPLDQMKITNPQTISNQFHSTKSHVNDIDHRLGMQNNFGTNEMMGKNALLSSSTSSVQHADHSKENLEMYLKFVLSRYSK